VFFHRTVDVSEWNERGDELVYHVRANAFLRRMVRAMVGSMLAVGRGELALETLDAILDGAPRERACTTAPSNGLCLVDVTWHPLPSLPLPPDWRHGTNAATVPFSSNG
jgi:tRNA pseudouridine38-40 synthase